MCRAGGGSGEGGTPQRRFPDPVFFFFPDPDFFPELGAVVTLVPGVGALAPRVTVPTAGHSHGPAATRGVPELNC